MMADQEHRVTAATHTVRVVDPLGNSISTLVYRYGYPLTRARRRSLDVFYPTNDEGLSLPTISLYSVHGDVAYRYPMTRARWTDLMNPSNNDSEEEQNEVVEDSADVTVEDEALSSIIRNLTRRGITVKRIVPDKKASRENLTRNKPRLMSKKKRKRKPNSGGIYCFRCDRDYGNIGGLFSAGCGHLFCADCLLSTEKCSLCRKKLTKLWQIYL